MSRTCLFPPTTVLEKAGSQEPPSKDTVFKWLSMRCSRQRRVQPLGLPEGLVALKLGLRPCSLCREEGSRRRWWSSTRAGTPAPRAPHAAIVASSGAPAQAEDLEEAQMTRRRDITPTPKKDQKSSPAPSAAASAAVPMRPTPTSAATSASNGRRTGHRSSATARMSHSPEERGARAAAHPGAASVECARRVVRCIG